MTPIDAGGKPMLGPDMNGILFDITSWLYALQGGQLYPYDSIVSTYIGGYAKGALLLMLDGAGYWISTVNANISNPDAGGADWEPVYAYGATAISGLTGGLRALSAVEAARYFLVMTGALVANQQVVLPNAYRNYLIVNATTGAFTLTVKTAAGTGVTVPQGGAASPTAVWCDTVNINRVFVPSALPTSITPVADTIVLRDNTGRQFAQTAPVGTSTTQVATTEFVIPEVPALGTDGWRMNADGSIEQWGFDTRTGSAPETVNFPRTFPNACFNVTATRRNASSNETGQNPAIVGIPGTASFQIAHADNSQGSYWRAVGN